jgi:hypothetical protein
VALEPLLQARLLEVPLEEVAAVIAILSCPLSNSNNNGGATTGVTVEQAAATTGWCNNDIYRTPVFLLFSPRLTLNSHTYLPNWLLQHLIYPMVFSQFYYTDYDDDNDAGDGATMGRHWPGPSRFVLLRQQASEERDNISAQRRKKDCGWAHGLKAVSYLPLPSTRYWRSSWGLLALDDDILRDGDRLLHSNNKRWASERALQQKTTPSPHNKNNLPTSDGDRGGCGEARRGEWMNERGDEYWI